MDTDVLVVGAGPTGLMLAAWLARLGVDHLVIDGKDGPSRESRAIAVQARTMEVYAQLGMIDAVRDQVTWAPRLRPGWHDRPAPGTVPIGRLLTGQTPYPGLHILEQSANERLLGDRLTELGGRVRWGHRLTGLTDRGTHVEAVVADGAHGDRRTTITARWCVGADGAGSATRELAGIGFAGETAEQTFWLADAHGVRGLSDQMVNLRGGAREFLIAFPMRGARHHRLIGMGVGELTEDVAREHARTVFKVTYDHADWYTTYRIHHRVADSFRVGRVLLAGDAGHVHSPVGGQGMNTGLQDAHNLAFKLADVLAGRASEALLDRYAAEREPIARLLVRTTDRLFQGVIDPSPSAVRIRRTVVPLLAPVIGSVVPRLPIAHRIAGYLSQTRIHYWMTEAQRRQRRRDRVVGRRLPWTGANHASLAAATWQVHGYGPDLPPLAGLPRLVTATHRFDPRPDLGLAEGRWLLIRPDGFVAAAATAGEGGEAGEAGRVFAAVLREHGYRDEVLQPHEPPRRSSV